MKNHKSPLKRVDMSSSWWPLHKRILIQLQEYNYRQRLINKWVAFCFPFTMHEQVTHSKETKINLSLPTHVALPRNGGGLKKIRAFSLSLCTLSLALLKRDFFLKVFWNLTFAFKEKWKSREREEREREREREREAIVGMENFSRRRWRTIPAPW